MFKTRGMICALGLFMMTAAVALAEKAPSPADGFTIHVIAPHKFEDGTVHGPYHHYCKGISPEILQCLLFESTDPNAVLTDIEYFVAKPIARGLPLNVWNKFYHDHEVEIATGRVQILDMPEEKAKEVAAAAAKTDGIIFHLWPKGAPAPTGEVSHPQAVGHKHRTQ
jgi:hypothetical protein